MINVFSIIGYISILDLGIPATIQRFTGSYFSRQQLDNLYRLLSAAITRLIIASAFAAFLLIIFRGLVVLEFFKLNGERGELVKILLIFQAIFNVFSFSNLLFKNALESLSCFKYVSIVAVLVETLKITSIISAKHFHLIDLSFVIYLYGICTIITFISYLYKFNKRVPSFRYNPLIFKFTRDEKRFSKSSLIGKLSSVVYNQSDKLLITYYLGPSSMAIYEVLSKIPLSFFSSKIFSISELVVLISGMLINVIPES